MNLETLQSIMLSMTQERVTNRVLQAIVEGLTAHPVGFALTRIWVKGPGDRCDACRFSAICQNKAQCLHLVASAGESVTENRQWRNLDGPFSRFPLGERKIGHIGASGESVFITNLQDDSQWMVDRAWAAAEGIKSFAGHPLTFRGEVLGVIGIFCRKGMNDDAFRWLRILADQGAIAIANARAFEEIERLKRELEDENALLREEVSGIREGRELIGESIEIKRLLEQVSLVAPTEAAILIEGESGSGKELVARALHQASKRAEKPLIKVNCAAIPRELFESEFFGHVKGAFTGAVRDRVGRFQLADRGTLFLDEVGEIPLELQSKLLRVLQEGEFERIGEATTRKVNVRIIAATNRQLKKESAEGRFREDLYYRLSVFPISVPPLRERKQDVPLLLAHFIQSAAHRLGVPVPTVSRTEVARLQEYSWPGNVRELGHVVERAVILARGGKADFSFVTNPASLAPPQTQTEPTPHGEVAPDKQHREQQIANIRRALEQTNGKIYGKDGAAELLGISPTTLNSRIRRWKI